MLYAITNANTNICNMNKKKNKNKYFILYSTCRFYWSTYFVTVFNFVSENLFTSQGNDDVYEKNKKWKTIIIKRLSHWHIQKVSALYCYPLHCFCLKLSGIRYFFQSGEKLKFQQQAVIIYKKILG